MKNAGMVHYYYGDGKGKTTSAFGLCLRAAGHNFKVLILQLLKSKETGERNALKNFNNITLIPCPEKVKFAFKMNSNEISQLKKEYLEIINQVFEKCEKEKYDMLFIDEIGSCIDLKIVDKGMLIDLIKKRPKNLEIIMTGHKENKDIFNICDYVSYIKKIKHPFDSGISARTGIEK